MAQFEKGQSGNPNGRPKGSGRTHELRKTLLSRAPELISKAIDDALEGDKAMMKLCLDRILPALKSQEMTIHNCGFYQDFPLIDLDKTLFETIDSDSISVSWASELLAYANLRAQLLEILNKDAKLISDKKLDKLFTRID